jgi:hypothetical protein
MDQTTLLSIAGITITVVLGIWSIYLAVRHRYPGRITFIEELSIELIGSLTKNLPDLSIRYKDLPVADNLLLFKGYLLNNGRKDIAPGMVEQPLYIDLPLGFKWLAANISSASPNVKATLAIKGERRIEFTLGLFRCGEHFKLEALVEGPVGKSLGQAIVFSHRIADTGKVRKATIEDLTGKRSLPLLVATSLIMVICVACFFQNMRFVDTGLFREGNRLIEVEAFADDTHSRFDVVGTKESFYKKIAFRDPRLAFKPNRTFLWLLLPGGFGVMALFLYMEFSIGGFWRRRLLGKLSQETK